MNRPRQADPSPSPGRRPPEYVVEAWVSQQLKDRIQRLDVIPADLERPAPQKEPPEPELEAEP